MSEEETTEAVETESTETTEAEPTETTETTEETTTNEPPEGSKRWNEIYYEAKESKRKLADMEETMNAMIDHNKALQETMDGVVDKVASTERPDPIVDPDGYDEWILERAAKRSAPKAEPTPMKPPDKCVPNQILIMESTMREVYDDYDVVIANAKGDFKDPLVGKKIMQSSNPPKAAYDYGKSKMAAAEKARGEKISGAQPESGTLPGGNDNKGSLTAAEKKVAVMLGIDEKKYLAQKEHIAKTRG